MGCRVAVIGCGHWGQNLVRVFHQLGSLAAVVEPSPVGRGIAEQLAPSVPAVKDWNSILADPAISALAIATPAETHAELCARALRAGKDVFCEKPLALEHRQAAELNRLAKTESRVLMVGHIMEYHPAIGKLRQLISDGSLGELRYVHSSRLNLGRVRQEENILWSFAPHDVAVILRLIGAMPERVLAGGGAYLRPHVADVTLSQLFFPGGRAAHIFVSWLSPFKEQRLVVIGSRRMATFDDVRKELLLHDQPHDIEQGFPPARSPGVPVAYADAEPLLEQCAAFLAALRSRQPPLTDGDSAERVTLVLQHLQRSLGNGGQPQSLASEI